MSTNADVPGLRISSYMNLEQAMGEVRAYLEAKKKHTGGPAETAAVAAGQLSLQNAFADRLADISRRLGEIEPNSKLGPSGIFVKRILRKLIGWYSKPAQEFDRTAVEAFRQIRQDMLQLQRQVAELNRKPVWSSNAEGNQQKLLSSMLTLFRSMLDAPSVRETLQHDKPELLQRVDRLLESVEREFRAESIAGDNSRTDR
jgi:hypothetical protein